MVASSNLRKNENSDSQLNLHTVKTMRCNSVIHIAVESKYDIEINLGVTSRQKKTNQAHFISYVEIF